MSRGLQDHGLFVGLLCCWVDWHWMYRHPLLPYLVLMRTRLVVSQEFGMTQCAIWAALASGVLVPSLIRGQMWADSFCFSVERWITWSQLAHERVYKMTYFFTQYVLEQLNYFVFKCISTPGKSMVTTAGKLFSQTSMFKLGIISVIRLGFISRYTLYSSSNQCFHNLIMPVS